MDGEEEERNGHGAATTCNCTPRGRRHEGALPMQVRQQHTSALQCGQPERGELEAGRPASGLRYGPGKGQVSPGVGSWQQHRQGMDVCQRCSEGRLPVDRKWNGELERISRDTPGSRLPLGGGGTRDPIRHKEDAES